MHVGWEAGKQVSHCALVLCRTDAITHDLLGAKRKIQSRMQPVSH